MRKMRVLISLEFDDVESGSTRDETIVNGILESLEHIQTAFHASSVGIQDLTFYPDGEGDLQ